MVYLDDAEPEQRSPSRDTRDPVGNQRPLIIERPDLQTAGQRWGYRSLTALCWVLWLYLFMPLVSVLAWALGLTWAYRMLLQDLELIELWHMVTAYSAGIGALSAVYMFWAVTSYFRFRRASRRKSPSRVADELLAASHNLGVAELQVLRDGERLVIPPDQLDRMFGKQVVSPGPEVATGADGGPRAESCEADSNRVPGPPRRQSTG